MERVTIIGCGWLGLPLGRQLAEAGYTVKGTTRSMDRFPVIADFGILPVLNRFDATTDEAQLLASTQVDAAVVTVPWSRQAPDEENRKTFARIAETLSMEGVERVIMVSSTSVYPHDLPICTELDADPQHPLVEVEKEFLGRLPSVAIVRFAGLIGPGRHPARFLAGRKNVPSPDAAVNLIHLDDCIGVIRSLLETRAEGIFNACTPDHPPRREYYTEACRRLGIEPPVFTPGDSSAGREISTVKLIEETGYHYRHNDLYAALEHCLLPGPQNGL